MGRMGIVEVTFVRAKAQAPDLLHPSTSTDEIFDFDPATAHSKQKPAKHNLAGIVMIGGTGLETITAPGYGTIFSLNITWRVIRTWPSRPTNACLPTMMRLRGYFPFAAHSNASTTSVRRAM